MAAVTPEIYTRKQAESRRQHIIEQVETSKVS